MERVISALGLFLMMAIAWSISENRKKVPVRAVVGGLLLQLALAIFILKTPWGMAIFDAARIAIQKVVSLSDQGAKFVFGDNFSEHFFAFSVLPTIIFVSALSSVLFYFGVLQKIVEFMARIMVKVMGCSGAESLCTAVNVFVGQTEAPILIRPYLASMTRSEILCMMIGGMATVAGGVLAAYVAFGVPAGHLLSASLMSAPATILIAKLILPEVGKPKTMGHAKLQIESKAVNVLDAACQGASDGLGLALNVAAMLIAFIALVALVNLLLGMASEPFGHHLTLELLFGYIFRPLAYMMGIPWKDCAIAGQLLGEKTVINEFYAYVNMGKYMAAGQLSQRAIDILTYALCGFANFSSIAIQIGGIGVLAPERRKDLADLGFRAFIGGNLASFMTACVAGILL